MLVYDMCVYVSRLLLNQKLFMCKRDIVWVKSLLRFCSKPVENSISNSYRRINWQINRCLETCVMYHVFSKWLIRIKLIKNLDCKISITKNKTCDERKKKPPGTPASAAKATQPPCSECTGELNKLAAGFLKIIIYWWIIVSHWPFCSRRATPVTARDVTLLEYEISIYKLYGIGHGKLANAGRGDHRVCVLLLHFNSMDV